MNALFFVHPQPVFIPIFLKGGGIIIPITFFLVPISGFLGAPLLSQFFFISFIVMAFYSSFNLGMQREMHKIYRNLSTLEIGEENILLFKNKKFFLERKHIQTSLRSDIRMLIYSPSYQVEECVDLKKDEIRRINSSTEGSLCLHAGSQQYEIKDLKADEFWALGQIMSNYLDIELQVVYPTPELPPEPNTCGGC